MQVATVTMHRDKNATSHDVDVGPDALLVRSMFFTLQGEGPYAGKPALFLRLGGCNLGAKGPAGCAGCDTDFRIEKSTALTFEEIEQKLLELIPETVLYEDTASVLLVVTGGEPSLHQQLPAFLHYSGFRTVQLESNGFNVDTLLQCATTGADVVLSPKASVKGYSPSLTPQAVDTFLMRLQGHVIPTKDIYYKFVVSADPVNMHHKLPDWVTSPERPNVDIYVSPCTEYLRAYEGEVSSAWDHTLVDAERTQANYAYAAQLAMQYNLRLSIQTHTLTAIP